MRLLHCNLTSVSVLTSGLLVALFSQVAFSSGSEYHADGRNSGNATYYKNKQLMGKRVLEAKVLCQSCALAGVLLNDISAAQFKSILNSNAALKQALSRKERQSVYFYLNKQ